MKARAPQRPERRKALTTRDLARRGRCRRCPFCAPSGKCLEPAIKSGRCGDWVWYVLPGNKQCRRLWVKPRDPRTANQLHWRARLANASKKYSAVLTDKQLDACIAAGAKRRSRPRLGQWGWLPGQQYWVGQACARKAEAGGHNAEKPTESLKTKGISTPTWEPHRSTSVVPPGHHRQDTGQARTNEGRTKKEEGRTGAERVRLRPFRTPHSALRTPSGPGRGEGHRSRGRQMHARFTWEQSRIGSMTCPWQYRRGDGQRMGNAGCRTRNGGEGEGRLGGHQRELWRGT